jgi:hypothetical protein
LHGADHWRRSDFRQGGALADPAAESATEPELAQVTMPLMIRAFSEPI